MPKECRRKTSKDSGISGINEGSRLERRAAGKSSQICDDLIQKAAQIAPSSATGAPAVMDARRVPQVTITPEGGGCSREMQQEDWEDVVDGPLRRKLSNSSISSTGSSAVESEDDLLSDNESKSKGIITLEHLVDTGEVSQGCYIEGRQSGWFSRVASTFISESLHCSFPECVLLIQSFLSTWRLLGHNRFKCPPVTSC